MLFIRNLEDEIEQSKQELERAKAQGQGMVHKIRQSEEQLQAEERKLSQARLELSRIAEKRRILESQAEPEPTDVAALVCFYVRLDFWLKLTFLLLSQTGRRFVGHPAETGADWKRQGGEDGGLWGVEAKRPGTTTG